MIHALIADSHDHTTRRSFATLDGLTRNETPSLFELEARAREFVVRITHCPKGYQWASTKSGAGYFDSRQDALRDAYECGELGE